MVCLNGTEHYLNINLDSNNIHTLNEHPLPAQDMVTFFVLYNKINTQSEKVNHTHVIKK